MEPINQTPANANFSNVDGTSTHEGPDSPPVAPQEANFLRDYLLGKALDYVAEQGWEAAKKVGQDMADAWDAVGDMAQNSGRGASQPNGYSPFPFGY